MGEKRGTVTTHYQNYLDQTLYPTHHSLRDHVPFEFASPLILKMSSQHRARHSSSSLSKFGLLGRRRNGAEDNERIASLARQLWCSLRPEGEGDRNSIDVAQFETLPDGMCENTSIRDHQARRAKISPDSRMDEGLLLPEIRTEMRVAWIYVHLDVVGGDFRCPVVSRRKPSQ